MQWWEMSGPGGRTICLSCVRVVQSDYPEGTTQTSDRQTHSPRDCGSSNGREIWVKEPGRGVEIESGRLATQPMRRAPQSPSTQAPPSLPVPQTTLHGPANLALLLSTPAASSPLPPLQASVHTTPFGTGIRMIPAGLDLHPLRAPTAPDTTLKTVWTAQ